MTEFIFMLTHHDVTVSNALDVLEEVKDSGIRLVGCKDVGLSLGRYKELFKRMERYGLESFLEVVTYDKEAHFRGVDLALKCRVDNLIGGMPWYTEETIEYLTRKGKEVGFYPYIGKISGHPCIQEGTVEETIESGIRAETLGVDGINLLLYRYTGDRKRLLKEAVDRLRVPLIVAGNVSRPEQIDELKAHRIWAFTIGGAVFGKKFVEGGSYREQVEAVLKRL
ncbi:MAG: hypothetical protein QW390_01225 [Candidatus Bathyarchaeia archaeon]